MVGGTRVEAGAVAACGSPRCSREPANIGAELLAGGVAHRRLPLVEKLRAYVDIYAGVLRNDRMCLCGMLAADYVTLPEPMKSAVTHFFEANERWLATVLEQGRAAGELQFAGSPLEVARFLVSSLEGAMLVARSFNDVSRFQSIADRLLTDLSAADPHSTP
jgi:TetR/AcrR family transcriptional repressor of nem operon